MLQNETNVRLHNVFEAFTKAIKVIDNDHAYIHQGIMFSAFDKPVITAGATVAYGFKTPATGYVHYRLAGINPSVDKVDTQIYRGAVYTGGTVLASNNKNENSTITAGAILTKSPTFSVDGTLVPGFSSYLPGSTGVGQAREGSSGQSESEIVLKQNTSYRFLITNGSAASNTIGVNFKWYEEPNG